MPRKPWATELVLLFGLIVFATATVAAPAKRRVPWLGAGFVLRKGPSGARFLYTAGVQPGSPAAAGGLRMGDVVEALDGKPVRFTDDLDLLEFVAARKPGTTLRLGVVREGKPQELRIVIGMLPSELEPLAAESLERARTRRARKP